MMQYTEFLALAQSRRSIRRFSNRRPAREDLLRLLEAAQWAPSNHNRQPWRFLVLEDAKAILNLARVIERELVTKLKTLPTIASGYTREFAHHATCFAGAPVLIAVLHKQPVSFAKALLDDVSHADLVSGEPLSAAMAVQNLLLAAQALGMGTCVLTAPLMARQAVARELAPTAGYELNCLVALGYPGEAPAAPRRKSIEQIAEFRNDVRGSQP